MDDHEIHHSLPQAEGRCQTCHSTAGKIAALFKTPLFSPMTFTFSLPINSLQFHLHSLIHTFSFQFLKERETKMGFYTYLLVVSMSFYAALGDPLVPALNIFGDSVVDVGNNNKLQTLIKANFPPYGRDFVNHKPTGRFCNGKLATDFTAEYLGFTTYPPAYLSDDAQGRKIITGVNFASAASGYYDRTAQLYRAITLTQQLAYYREWQMKVVNLVGKARANTIFSRGIHLLSAGSSDFIQNYYINPLLNRAYTPDQFSDILMQSFSAFVQSLYRLGVRRIGVTTLPPTGCLPAAITLFGSGTNLCVARLNQDAISFNNKLNITSQNLKSNLPGLKLVVFDIYNPLLNLITKPEYKNL